MTWPFKVPENKPPDPDPANAEGKDKDKGAPPEKTAAELLADALAPLKEGLDALKNDFNAMKEAAQPKPKPAGDDGGGQPVSVLDDENAAFAQRMTPLLARQLELESRVVYNDIKQEYIRAGMGELWDQFESDIKKVIDGSPLVGGNGQPMRGDPQYIRNVVDMVLGRAARNAGMRFDGKTKGFFLEPAGGDAGAAPVHEEDGMTEAQRKVVNRMNIPLDKAKDVMKKLHFVQ